MSCPYFNQCSETIKCGTCMHNKYRSYYVAYHEYPADNTFKGLRPWPYLPVETGNDFGFPNADYTWPAHVMERNG